MATESLILRRCYPVPVTFADLRRAAFGCGLPPWDLGARHGRQTPIAKAVRTWWHAALKESTGAIDEVYAVVDGREVRVAIVDNNSTARILSGGPHIGALVNVLMTKADEAGYWERPHEVVHVLEERAISRRTVDLACGVTPDKAGV